MSEKFEHLMVDLVYDIILAYIFYILIESPFFNVFNHFMRPKVRSEVKQNPTTGSGELNNNIYIKSEKSLNGINNNNNNNNNQDHFIIENAQTKL